MTVHSIQFSIPAKYVTAISPNYISENGPYVAAHLGRINKVNGVGQAYYVRPFSSYDKKHKRLTINMDKDQLTVHKNDNKVTKDIAFEGRIVIENFEYNKGNPDQIIHVNMKVINNTGSRFRGIHIHNGLLKDKEFTFYGKIAYFLFSTKYWMEKKTEFHKKSIPLTKIFPATNFIIKLSER